MSWEEAETRLGEVSDALSAADAAVRGKQELQDATRFLRLPEITGEVRRVEIQKTINISPLQSILPGNGLEVVHNSWRTRPVIQAVMPLYTGGMIPAAQKAAEGATQQASAERDQQRQSLQVQLVQAYFGQQLATEAVVLRKDILDGLNRHLFNAEKLEQEGFATRAQKLQATVARDRAEREHQKALNDLSTLQSAVSTLLRSGTPVQPITPLFISTTPLETLKSFEQAAWERHPQVAKLQAMVGQAEQGVKAKEAELKPQVYLFGTYDLRREDEFITDPDWAFGIGLRYTFLSSSARPKQIRAAREQLNQAQEGLDEARNQVVMGVRQAWNELETARSQYLLLDSSIAQAEENLRLQELSFREGQGTSLDVIDARLQLGSARIERAQAVYQYDVTLAQLLEVSGQMGRFEEFRRRADRQVQP